MSIYGCLKKVERNGQHPIQTPVESFVDTLEIGDCNLFAKDHLVEAWDEECVEEAPMEDGHSDDASDELEIGEMFGVDVRGGVDLEGVTVHGGVGE